MKGRVFPLILLFCSALAHGYSQNSSSVQLKDRVDQSSLIVEGKVTAEESFWDQAKRIIYTSHTVEIYKVFKGMPRSATLEVITKGGVRWGQSPDGK